MRMSGCAPKCQHLKFVYNPGTEQKIDWQVNFNSSFFLGPKNPSFTQIQEYYQYDYADFVGDFGSYLGLFLGWSFFSILENVPVWFKRLKDCFQRKEPVHLEKVENQILNDIYQGHEQNQN
jgi:hypothetical protein